MLKRIIACLDIDGRNVVKGTQYTDHIDFGNPVTLAKRYAEEGADEIVIYDIKASLEGRTPYSEVISAVSRAIDIPLCVAGGLRTIEHARAVLTAGADKVSINTAALENPNLISELASEFGSQCVVVGIDVKSAKANSVVSRELVYYSGDLTRSKISNFSLTQWLLLAQEKGAGELVINSIQRDGTRSGYDIPLFQEIESAVKVPLIASSGAGTIAHFAELLQLTSVDGALAAGVFHRGEIQIPSLKQELLNLGLPIRPHSPRRFRHSPFTGATT